MTDGNPAAPVRRDPRFAARFDAMSAFVSSSAGPGEILFASLRGERADYLRLNGARVRQAGSVERAVVSLRVVDAQRQARSVRTLGEDAAIGAVLAEAHAELRAVLARLPADPYACWQPMPSFSERVRGGPAADPAAIIDTIAAAADGDDLVGLYAGGPVVRGLASSLGHRHYHETVSSSFDFSLHLEGGRALKDTWAAEQWDAQSLHAAIAAARERADVLRRPSRRLAPGDYRVLLSPQAVADLVALLGWGGFSERAHRSAQSPLSRAQRGLEAFDAGLSVAEDADALGVPRFQDDGFERPARVPLIDAGRPAQRLVSPRSAREFDATCNGADDDERPLAACVAPGRLPAADALRALDTGIAISNVWYLNYSDRDACRATGMTRFATLWVENGHPVAPIEPMRFDDSLYRTLGSQLLGLTDVARRFPETATWDGREPGGACAPSALVGALRFTL
ncbi:MAG TPA: metallopeptidase TldD-related protein [Burkholderiaceae bacterium]|nr:metallopeptidase TldD-related protein [Burkholderiaceae bacterium]HRA77344.1 metallopeptidase TldD-related protein [Burkholderiaceae bacterium]